MIITTVHSFVRSPKALQTVARKTVSVLTMVAMVFGSFSPLVAFPASALALALHETITTTVVHAGDLDNTSSSPAVVAADGLNKWFMYNDTNDTIDNTLGTFVAGPSVAPVGNGSIQFTLGASPLNRENIATYQFGGTPLSTIAKMGFSAYSHSGVAGASESPFLNFNVDFTGSSTSWQKRLVYIPSANGVVPQDAWNTFDVINGENALWNYSGANWPAGVVSGGSIPGTTARTWSSILSDYPNARILPGDSWLGVRVGEPGPTNYTGNVDKFFIGTVSGSDLTTKIFDFDPYDVLGSIEIMKYACPEGTAVTRDLNGVDGDVPAGCVPQTGATFGYVHGTQTDVLGPYPELPSEGGVITEAGATTAGTLTISGLPSDGRYLVMETDGAQNQLAAGDVLGLYCIGDGDTSGNNDNQELTFVPVNGTVNCVGYNKFPPSEIVVHKVIDNTGGGTATVNSFSYTVNDGGSVNFDTEGNATTTGVVGNYNVVENNAASYSTGYSAGCEGSITLGETKNCTITNTYIVPPAPSCDAVLSSDTVVSNGGESVDGVGSAVETWEHDAWLDESADGAKWIWSDAEVVNPGINETHVFSENFSITGTPLGGTLYVAADNGYEVSINGNPICSSNTTDPHYGAYETCAVSAGDLNYGVNTITATTTNLGYPQDPTSHANPAGIIYKLVLDKNACIPQSDVTICKSSDQDQPLAGWTMTLKGENVEDVVVPTDTSAGINTVNALLSGVSYIATAVGTWLNQGGANAVDAEYSSTTTPPWTTPWATHMDGFTGYQTDILELQIDNEFDPTSVWGAYNSAHTYAQSFLGTGATSNFRVFDGTGTTPEISWYGDNQDTLAVNISKGYAGITAANGCVVFEDVPTGTYTLGEIMQDGWNNVTGLGAAVVSHATETFNVVNHFTPPAEQCNPDASSTIVSDVTTQEGGTDSFLVSFIHASWTAVIGGASWIWGEDPVADPTNVSTETFTKTFSVTGTPLGATLDLAADNTFSVAVNGNDVCASAAENNFSATTTCAIPASSLVSGVNTLVFTVTNLQLPEDWQGEVNDQTNPAGLLYKLTINNNECVTPDNSFVKVHLYKYLQTHDGETVIDTQVPNDSAIASFPMKATWNAIISGNPSTGTDVDYVLGNYHGQALLKYAADTSPMQAPVAHYTSYENTSDTNVLPIAAACSADMYRLVGYKSGPTLEAAQGASLQSTAPDYTNFNSDKYVIVVNEDCNDVISQPEEPESALLTLVKHTVGGNGTFNFTLSGTSTTAQLTTVGGWATTTLLINTGSTTITELQTSGWTYDGASCIYENESAGIAVEGGKEVRVDNGDEVTCTFTNTKNEEEPTPTFSYSTTTVRATNLATSTSDVIANPTKWFFYDDNTDTINNSFGSFISTTTAPLGLGSAEITDGAAGIGDRTDLATYAFASTTLASITALKFSAYSHSGVSGANESPYLVFNVSFNGANTWQKRLVYVPSANGAVPQDVWNTYDTINGGAGLWTWSGYAGNGNKWPDNNTSEYRTWSAIKAAFPSAAVRATDSFMGVRVGEPGPTNYTGDIDNFVIGIKTGANTDTKTFDFEPPVIETHEDSFTGNTAPQGFGGNGPLGFFFGPVGFLAGTGVVLGAATSTVTGDETMCNAPILSAYMRRGFHNDSAQVRLLQAFLNKELGLLIPLTGFFGPMTEAAVNAFQLKYAAHILAPWYVHGLPTGTPTGYVYKTTMRWINLIHCSALSIPEPTLP